ncbi:MAG: hypothetical protein ACP5NB_09285 [Chloroflexia bacterium]
MLGGESTRQASLEMFLQLYRSKVLFFRKHRGRPAVLAYKGVAEGNALGYPTFGVGDTSYRRATGNFNAKGQPISLEK